MKGIDLGRNVFLTDARSEVRFPVKMGAVLQVEGNPAAVCVVTILDISVSGMRASCPIPMQPGVRVAITCQYATISGEVRYVREVSEDQFNIGIKADQQNETDLDLTDMFHPAPFLEVA